MSRRQNLLHRIGLVETIWGSAGTTPYLTRVHLTPRTKIGQLCLHIFWRGDEDPDPHDHPFDFWTFPLCRDGYIELTPNKTGDLVAVQVSGWWLTRRKAEYAHLIVGRCVVKGRERFIAKGTLATLVWMGPRRREWGFWPRWIDAAALGLNICGTFRGGRVHVPWDMYLLLRA
jgi:hypothetical protein